jgi:hypothetical protein
MATELYNRYQKSDFKTARRVINGALLFSPYQSVSPSSIAVPLPVSLLRRCRAPVAQRRESAKPVWEALQPSEVGSKSIVLVIAVNGVIIFRDGNGLETLDQLARGAPTKLTNPKQER